MGTRFDIERKKVSKKQIEAGLVLLCNEINCRLIKHGSGVFVSSHEILGAVTEEYFELVDAVKTGEHIEEELMDVAVGALFGAICLHMLKPKKKGK